jgi:hypothetical protein
MKRTNKGGYPNALPSFKCFNFLPEPDSSVSSVKNVLKEIIILNPNFRYLCLSYQAMFD